MSHRHKVQPSPSRLLCSHWAQTREKLRLADWFLQDGRDLPRCQRKSRVAGSHDDPDPLIMQSIDQAIGPLAPSEIEVDEGYVGGMIGDQSLGLGRGRDGSVHIRSPGPKQVLQASAPLSFATNSLRAAAPH
jgi:hypothetical protein